MGKRLGWLWDWGGWGCLLGWLWDWGLDWGDDWGNFFNNWGWASFKTGGGSGFHGGFLSGFLSGSGSGGGTSFFLLGINSASIGGKSGGGSGPFGLSACFSSFTFFAFSLWLFLVEGLGWLSNSEGGGDSDESDKSGESHDVFCVLIY